MKGKKGLPKMVIKNSRNGNDVEIAKNAQNSPKSALPAECSDKIFFKTESIIRESDFFIILWAKFIPMYW